MASAAASIDRETSVRGLQDLVGIVARLRGEGGCPWDRAQTPETLRPYVLEEAYEVLDAIDRGADADLRKELGDLLFQIALLARMAEERGAFDLSDVVAAVSDKMVRRHPHVFDAGHVPTAQDGEVAAWEARKHKERPAGHSALDGVPEALPALLRAHRISEKASAVGFDWPDRVGVRAKVTEELVELDHAIAAGDDAAMSEELGDLLFALVNLGRFLPTPAEDALRTATTKFERRFRAVEALLAVDGRTVHATDPDTLETYWRRAKEGEWR